MKKNIAVALMLIVFGISAKAQHQELTERAVMYKGKQNNISDSTSLLHAFQAGSIHGHSRYFFMSTQNQKGLSDYYANAAGGGIRYETAKFYGFQFAVSGFYTFNIGSSNLAELDDSTGQSNRYEIALFDVEDPLNKKDIDRLEEFNLKYNNKQSSIVFGRQLINTPFINLQDGRMRPTGVEGIWLEINEIPKTKIEGGWLYAISPRATVKWFTPGESIGLYPAGVNLDGTKSGYEGNVESKGVAVLGITTKIAKNIKLQGWNMLTQNVFNTSMLQADVIIKKKGDQTVFAAAQFIRQDALNEGGNLDPSKTYFTKANKSITFGGKFGLRNERSEASINYNRITAGGRYLVPREWGREPFFTFMPRERNEGFGDVHAIMGKVNHDIKKVRIKTSLAAGYFELPDVKYYRLNKYGLPSYTQLNAEVRYSFAGTLEGLDAQLLGVMKLRNGETYNNKKFEFNKVNMMQYNFVLNYHF